MASIRKSASTPQVFEFEISLRWLEPRIWRRFAISEKRKLSTLHKVIQIVMGWDDSHLHRFEIGGQQYSANYPDFRWEPEDDVEDELYHQVGKVLSKGATFQYLYDFGDDWYHEVKVVKTYPRPRDMRLPICLDGARACPPEDVGGVGGYQSALEILKAPEQAEDPDFLEWLGEDFDPELFDLRGINRALRRLR